MQLTFSALLAASALALPAYVQAQPAKPAPRVQPPSRVVIQQEQREHAAERERQRAMQRDNHRAQQSERLEHTFKIGGSGELQVSNLTGDITITRGGGNQIRVEAIKTARARTDEQARELLPAVRVEFLERGGRAEIKTIYPRENFGGSNARNVSVSVVYAITAPEGTSINVRSLTGNLKVTGIKGQLSLVSLSGDVRIFDGARVSTATSTSGDVEIRNLESKTPIEARSTSGNITVANARMPRLELGTISGSVSLENVQAEQIEAQTLSGDLNLAFPFSRNGRYDLNSHSGDVNITLIGDTGFELDANTFSGNVRSGVTLVERSTGANNDSGRAGRVRRLRGRFGDGNALLDVTTFSGNVTITKK